MSNGPLINSAKQAFTTEAFAAAKAAFAAYAGDSARNSIRPADPSPLEALKNNLANLQGDTQQVFARIEKLHAKLGGAVPLPTVGNADLAPCGGDIGSMIEVTRSIARNLEGTSDLLGYLETLTA